MRARLALLPVLLLLGAAKDAAKDDAAPAAIQAFREALEASRDEEARRAAVDALGRVRDPRVVQELVRAGKELSRHGEDAVLQKVFEALGRQDLPEASKGAYALLGSRPPLKHVLFLREGLRLLRDPEALEAAAKEGVRSELATVAEATADALSEGGGVPVAERLAELLDHPAPRVRAVAAEAVGRTGGDGQRARLELLRKDRDPVVADSALVGLVWLRRPEILDDLARQLREGDWVLRSRLARALGAWKGDPRAERMLLESLVREHGRLVPLIAASLEKVTGQKLGTNAKAWIDWWNRTRTKPREQGGMGEEAFTTKETLADSQPHRYFEIVYFSERMVFVEDLSGSMAEGAVTKDRDDSKITKAKDELSRILGTLSSRVSFNIVYFSRYAALWKTELVPADPKNVADARKLVAGMGALGSTNAQAALALAVGGLLQAPTGNPKSPRKAFVDLKGPDTVLFLTDGRPTSGASVDAYEILAEFTWGNRFQGLQCFTFGFGKDQDPVFLDLLARWNEGAYKRMP